MANQKKQKKRFNRLNLMIISAIASVILWIVIVQTVNPEISYTINDVPVKIVGENIVRERGVVVVNRDELPKFSVKITGKRSDVMYGMEGVSVNLDVSSVFQAGEFQIMPTVYTPQSLYADHQNFDAVILRFSKSESRQIPVKTEIEGLSKASIAEVIPSVENVTVNGSVEEIQKVNQCIIQIDAEDLSDLGTTTGSYPYVFADEDGNELTENKTLACNMSRIEAGVFEYNRVDIPVEVSLSNEAKKKYKIDIDMESLSDKTVSGGVRIGKSMTKAKYIIPDGEYNEGRCDFEAVLEENENIYVENKTVKVSGDVTKLKAVTVMMNIEALNQPSNVSAVFEKRLQVTVYVPENYEMNTELNGTVDLAGRGAGTHTLTITPDDQNVVLDKPEIKVKIKKAS